MVTYQNFRWFFFALGTIFYIMFGITWGKNNFKIYGVSCIIAYGVSWLVFIGLWFLIVWIWKKNN